MLTETQLSERLHAATEQIDVEFSIEDVIGEDLDFRAAGNR